MVRGYNKRMIRKHLERVPRIFQEISLFKKKKAEIIKQKLTFNISYYPVFQNVRNISQELHLLLAPDKKHKKVFPNILVGFTNCKSLENYIVR